MSNSLEVEAKVSGGIEAICRDDSFVSLEDKKVLVTCSVRVRTHPSMTKAVITIEGPGDNDAIKDVLDQTRKDTRLLLLVDSCTKDESTDKSSYIINRALIGRWELKVEDIKQSK